MRASCHRANPCSILLLTSLAAAAIFYPSSESRADEIVLKNGDHITGKVLSVATNMVVLQSELLGKITLPREQVTQVAIGEKSVNSKGNGTNVAALMVNPKTPSTLLAPGAKKNADSELAIAIRGLGTNSSSVKQISDQLLTGADPAAKKKYNELVAGLATGNLSIANIRTEAQSAITQVRQYRKELGEDAGDSLDSYIAVLEGFLKETASEDPDLPKTAVAPPSKPRGSTFPEGSSHP